MLCLVVQYWCRIRQMGQDEHIGSRCEQQVGNLKFGTQGAKLGEELDETGIVSGGTGTGGEGCRDDKQRHRKADEFSEYEDKQVFSFTMGNEKQMLGRRIYTLMS